MTKRLFAMTKDEFADKRDKLIGLIKSYSETGDFSESFRQCGFRDRTWDNVVRNAIYAYTMPDGKELFYMTYGTRSDITRQHTINDTLKSRTTPYCKKMQSIYSEGLRQRTFIMFSDIGETDAWLLEGIIKQAVAEYNIEGVLFPGLEQLSPAKTKYVYEFDGIKQYGKKGNRDIAYDFDVIRAIRNRSSETGINNNIANRVTRQEFWTSVMEDETVNHKERLKASELLGRSEGDFLDRVKTDVDVNIRSILDMVNERRGADGKEEA